MVKQVSVTFEFDPETELVSNVHAFVDGIEKKKKTTRKTPEKEIVLEDKAIITREDNKLIFNNKAAKDMDISAEDRIVIIYEKINKVRVPIIGTDIAFNQEGSGNKVTKTNTVVYRGKANTILAEYGTVFEIEPYKEGIWKMISNNKKETVIPTTYEEAESQANNVEADLLTEDDNTTEIDELTFKL